MMTVLDPLGTWEVAKGRQREMLRQAEQARLIAEARKNQAVNYPSARRRFGNWLASLRRQSVSSGNVADVHGGLGEADQAVGAPRRVSHLRRPARLRPRHPHLTPPASVRHRSA